MVCYGNRFTFRKSEKKYREYGNPQTVQSYKAGCQALTVKRRGDGLCDVTVLVEISGCSVV
jgi:hypothetical protein